MCGIIGSVGKLKDEDFNWLKKAVIELKHRGPDASSSWTLWACNRWSLALGLPNYAFRVPCIYSDQRGKTDFWYDKRQTGKNGIDSAVGGQPKNNLQMGGQPKSNFQMGSQPKNYLMRKT